MSTSALPTGQRISAQCYSLSAGESLRQLNSRDGGLAAEEIEPLLAAVGPNQIRKFKTLSPLKLLFKQFANFFVVVLLFAACLAYAISFSPGEEERRITAYFIMAIIAISVLLGFFEEYKAQKELEDLQKLLTFKAKVLRDGKPSVIDASLVVPGDILMLSYGQIVAADARVIQSHNLRTDESSLTGESVGVDKSVEAVDTSTPLAERTSMVYASTHVTNGDGLAVVVATGMQTEVGKIAETLGTMAQRPTPFQFEVQNMARQMTLIVSVLSAIVAAILWFVLHQPLLDIALNTLSLAVATIPESLPVVLTFALALGARQMASRKAVVRQLSVVESLGSVDTICTDKTGTLTRGAMTVQHVLTADNGLLNAASDESDTARRQVLLAGMFCNDATMSGSQITGDPVETALLDAARNAGIDVSEERDTHQRIDQIPFESQRKMMTTVHRTENALMSYSKGAPENILSRCVAITQGSGVVDINADLRSRIQQKVADLQNQGLYLIALAVRELTGDEPRGLLETGMTLLGLVAMIDPPRAEVSEAIAQARTAGIRVIMITGDSVRTGRAISEQVGIGSRCLESGDIDEMSPEQLKTAVREVDVVARATPLTKQRILEALQADGHFVAMTGDGVNDATALKQSDVGVAMGVRGTDIAKQSAAMVLLDDNFATIIAAVQEGRRIFDNIRKFTNYLLSTSLGEVFVVLALSAFGYFPLSASMLLWINVVTDLVPASALAADPAVPRIMTRRPRHHDEPILNKAIYATIAGSIFRTLIVYMLIFWLGLKFGGVSYARTMLFTSIVLHAFTRVLVVRQLDNLPLASNPALLSSYAIAVGLQLLALYTPLRFVFGVIPLDWRAWTVMALATAGSSLAGVYMTRWILKLVPLWRD